MCRVPAGIPSVVLVVTAVSLGPVPARAFDSFPGNRHPHATITAEAARRVGWDAALGTRLARQVRDIDMEDSHWAPTWRNPVRIVGSRNYRPEHHFDRPPDSTSQAAFDIGRRWLRREAARARLLAIAGDGPGARAALARALHALQDLHSHSNLVDLDSATVRAVYDAIADTTARVPVALRLTSFAGGPYGRGGPPRDPADPPGDREGYSHRHFAKDAPHRNAESAALATAGVCGGGPGRMTRFECARSLATEACTRMLREFDRGLQPGAWRAFEGP